MTEKEPFAADRSREAGEVLESPPAWLVRWGTLLMSALFLGLLLLSWLLPYPETLQGRVTVVGVAAPGVADGNGERSVVAGEPGDPLTGEGVAAGTGVTAKLELPAAAASRVAPGMEVMVILDPPSPQGMKPLRLKGRMPATPMHGPVISSGGTSSIEPATAISPGHENPPADTLWIEVTLAIPASIRDERLLPCPGLRGHARVTTGTSRLLFKLVPPLAPKQ